MNNSWMSFTATGVLLIGMGKLHAQENIFTANSSVIQPPHYLLMPDDSTVSSPDWEKPFSAFKFKIIDRTFDGRFATWDILERERNRFAAVPV
jgi:hypothetical protein